MSYESATHHDITDGPWWIWLILMVTFAVCVGIAVFTVGLFL